MGDLSRLETVLANDGVWFTPLDYEGNELEYEFLVLGSDSKTALKAMSEKNAKILDAFYERKKSKGKKQDDIVDDAMGSRLDFLAKIVKAWREKKTQEPLLLWKGKGLECTAENARMILEALPYLADQFDRQSGERNNFTKPASES